MYLARDHAQTIYSVLGSRSKRAFSVAAVVAGLVLAFAGGYLLKKGAPGLNGRPWDVGCLLDGAWRIESGQVPHRDFYSHLGSFPYYLAWLGIRVSHPSLSAIIYGNVMLMLALCLVAFLTLSRRTSALYSGLLTVFFGVLVISVRPLGDPYDCNDFAMLYNRFGEAFLGLFAALAFLPPLQPARSRFPDLLEAMLMGLLLTLLWFDKLNYFAIAVLSFGVALVLRLLDKRRAAACCISAICWLGVVLMITHVPLGSMLRDFRIMSQAQSLNLRVTTLIIQFIKSAWLLPLLMLGAWESARGLAQNQGERWIRFREWLVPLFIFGTALLILASNCQIEESPFLVIAAFYSAETVRRQSAQAAPELPFATVRNLATFCLVLFFLLPTLRTDLKAFRSGLAMGSNRDLVSSEILKSTNLNDMQFRANGSRAPFSEACIEWLDEGIELIRRHQSPETRLNALLGANPFHMALGLRPAEGGLICYAANTLSPRSHPALPRLVGNATHLLIARGASPGGVEISELYGDEWKSLKLEIVEQTKHFELLRVPH